jgi:hypothetical protein
VSTMGRSLFTPEAYKDNQELGQESGHIEIQCTLKAKECRWTTKPAVSRDVAEITKLLYFDIRYTDHGKGAVRTASVRIDVGKEVNDAPIPTFQACAPLAGIKGPPVRQHVLDSKTTDPQGELTMSGVGGKASGHRHEVSKETDNEHRWCFKAGHISNGHDPQVTRASFSWTRTLEEDRTSSDRLYQGALIVHREKDKPFVLRAQVKAKTWKWHQRLQYPRSKRFDSWPIQRPGSFLEFGEFIERENGIQKLVEDCNYALAPIGRLLPSRDTLFLLNPQ